MTEKILFTPKIIELSETNDIYMTMNICILSNDVNYNGAKFNDSFIQGVIDNKDKYIGIPFQASRVKLENGVYDNLSHEFDGQNLNTDTIGAFVNFWSEEIDGALCLMGEIRIYKRYVNTCNAIIELYEEGRLKTSCEALIKKYSSMESGIREIDYENGDNSLIASALVTDPAEPKAVATLLIAALEKDFKEVNNLSEKDTQLFNKGNEIKYHGQIETSAIKYSEVSNQIYNTLNPVDAQNGGRDYNYWIRDLYTEYVIAEDWEDYELLWKIPYSIENDVVILAAKDQWQQGRLGFIPNGVEITTLISEKENEISDLQNKLNQVKEELSNMEETKSQEVLDLETKVQELNSKIEELEGQITDLNETIVAQKEEKGQFDEKVSELSSTIEDLQKYKDQVEMAEKEAKQAEISSKYEKLISEEVFKSEDVQNAISELNSNALDAIVVAEILKQKEVEMASKKEEEKPLTVLAGKQEDLVNKDKTESWYSSRS